MHQCFELHFFFQTDIRTSRRAALQRQVINVIMRVLCRNPELHYYQVYSAVLYSKICFICETKYMYVQLFFLNTCFSFINVFQYFYYYYMYMVYVRTISPLFVFNNLLKTFFVHAVLKSDFFSVLKWPPACLYNSIKTASVFYCINYTYCTLSYQILYL